MTGALRVHAWALVVHAAQIVRLRAARIERLATLRALAAR